MQMSCEDGLHRLCVMLSQTSLPNVQFIVDSVEKQKGSGILRMMFAQAGHPTCR